MQKICVAPSILSADFAEMGAAVEELERCGADLIHCDVEFFNVFRVFSYFFSCIN